jgi:hypothetical protein
VAPSPLKENGGSILHCQGKSTPWIGINPSTFLLLVIYVDGVLKKKMEAHKYFAVDRPQEDRICSLPDHCQE